MNNQEPELNPKPDETDSAKKSVQRERSELPLDQQSSYLRSRQIALKKFSPKGGDPSRGLVETGALRDLNRWRQPSEVLSRNRAAARM